MEEKGGFYPVLGLEYGKEEYMIIDLSVANKDLEPYNVDSPEGMTNYLTDFKLKNHISIPYGGYGEKRFIYMNSPLFNKSNRCIHLGTDLWVAENTPLYAGNDAVVHSTAFNNNYLDYGATIILTYQIDNKPYHVLYGHLSLSALEGIYPGQTIKRGREFARVGNYHENGNWAPHLHLQAIWEIGENIGDYPGVCSEFDAPQLLNNCPDPETLIFQ